MTGLDQQLDAAMSLFAGTLADDSVLMREAEAVSVFVFSCLLGVCRREADLFDPGQIGIEVAVPQPQKPGIKRKAQVRKDLVIWPNPGFTCWDGNGRPVRAPLAVLEWKRPGWLRPIEEADARSHSEYDLKWLREFTRVHAGSLGLSVHVPRTRSGNRLSVVRVVGGEAERRCDFR